LGVLYILLRLNGKWILLTKLHYSCQKNKKEKEKRRKKC